MTAYQVLTWFLLIVTISTGLGMAWIGISHLMIKRKSYCEPLAPFDLKIAKIIGILFLFWIVIVVIVLNYK
jgi:hypothetical protein